MPNCTRVGKIGYSNLVFPGYSGIINLLVTESTIKVMLLLQPFRLPGSRAVYIRHPGAYLQNGRSYPIDNMAM